MHDGVVKLSAWAPSAFPVGSGAVPWPSTVFLQI
jgi:hypothetical protein